MSRLQIKSIFATDKWFAGVSDEVVALAMPLLQKHGVVTEDSKRGKEG